jgi:predicted transcriptional regulator
LGNNSSELIDKDAVLKRMNIGSIEKYSQFMRDIDSSDDITSKLKSTKRAKQGFQKPQLWVIGKPQFVKKVIELDRNRRLLIARHISENIEMEKIHEKVARILIMEKDDLFRAGQSNVRSTGRELFATICKKYYEFSGADAARYLRVTEAAVSRMLTRFGNVENGEYLIEKVMEEIN